MYQSTHFAWLGSRMTSLDATSLARALNASLASPGSAQLLKAVESGNWEEVTSIRCDPRAYLSPTSYLKDAIPANIFKKVQDLPVQADRGSATFKKWLASEHICFKTNQRLYAFLPGKVHHLSSDRAVSQHLAAIRKIIKSWIGDSPPQEIEVGFSPGSTLSDRGRTATVAHKLSNRPSTTPQYDNFGYRHFVGCLWHHNMVDAGLTPELVHGGEYFEVPKTALVNRSAELQPSINVSIQLGYGRLLKRLFRRNTGWTLTGNTASRGPGWDMSKAQDIHREVARKASVDQSFCTIDLSSASDTIAKVLVELLLPAAWFRHLDAIRTHRIFVPKDEGKDCYLLEKFSSMGNGFTFELETIIFAAVACYVSRQAGYWGELGFDVFVYGDDIIVRDELFSDVQSILAFLGFTTNVDKSFHGPHPFRESCGADFFRGVNVRCTNLEKINDLTASEIVSVANQIKHLSDRVYQAMLGNLNRCWFYVLGLLPRGISKLRGPAWLGDAVIYDPDQETWITERDNWEVRILTLGLDVTESWIPWSQFDSPTTLAVAVLGFGDGRKGLLPRKPAPRLKTAWATLCCVSAPL